METSAPNFDITRDDLSGFDPCSFVTLGETMVRETPADFQRPEATRQVYLALAGSEFSIAVLLARLGIPSAYISRVPDNPYGWMLRDTARANAVNVDHVVWADKTDLMGRYIYEAGRTPRPGVVWYQRKYSAASQLDCGMVDWAAALDGARLFHVSGITFGLATHSGYPRNYLLDAFHEAMRARPDSCCIGVDFNYRATLWSEQECADTMRPLITDHADLLITSIYDMAQHYGIGCGRFSAGQVLSGEAAELSDDDLRQFGAAVIERFDLRVVAVTLRQSASSEQHHWEAAAISRDGGYFRSPKPQPILLQDRIGGGDAWTGGFYYGLLTAGINAAGLEKAVLVGDAATRLKQTIMFDLPIVSRHEIQSLLFADSVGGHRGTVR
ncbi:MAG: sugar kinase [Anaerolinea sp.]|nr:sugar kinase [Anaerolinea sp.]